MHAPLSGVMCLGFGCFVASTIFPTTSARWVATRGKFRQCRLRGTLRNISPSTSQNYFHFRWQCHDWGCAACCYSHMLASCARVCAHVCVCVFLCGCVCVRVRTSLSLSLCMCVCMRVRASVCLSVFWCACGCVRRPTSQLDARKKHEIVDGVKKPSIPQ